MPTREEVLNNVEELAPRERRDVLLEAIENSSEEDKKSFALATARALPDPTPAATDRIWLIVVIAFVIVLVGSFAAMVANLFWKGEIDDKLLTIFTTVSAFLAGLLAPSPVNKV